MGYFSWNSEKINLFNNYTFQSFNETVEYILAHYSVSRLDHSNYWKDIKKLIRRELNEATTVDAGGSKFNLRTGENKNPTKLGIKLQFEPKGGSLEPDTKAKL